MTLIFSCPSADGTGIKPGMSHSNLCFHLGTKQTPSWFPFSAGSRFPLKYELQNFGPFRQDCKSADLCSPASTSCFVNDAATSERETRCAAVTFHNWSLFRISQNSRSAATIWAKLSLTTPMIWPASWLRSHPSVLGNTGTVWRVPGSNSWIRPRQEPGSDRTGRLAPGFWSQPRRGGG